MNLRYREFSQRTRKNFEEGGGDYFLPDFRRLLSLALRLVVEVGIMVHLLKRSGYIDASLNAKLYQSTAELRRTIAKIKDMIS